MRPNVNSKIYIQKDFPVSESTQIKETPSNKDPTKSSKRFKIVYFLFFLCILSICWFSVWCWTISQQTVTAPNPKAMARKRREE